MTIKMFFNNLLFQISLIGLLDVSAEKFRFCSTLVSQYLYTRILIGWTFMSAYFHAFTHTHTHIIIHIHIVIHTKIVIHTHVVIHKHTLSHIHTNTFTNALFKTFIHNFTVVNAQDYLKNKCIFRKYYGTEVEILKCQV